MSDSLRRQLIIAVLQMKMIGGMSCTGNCYDNALMEGFRVTTKMERIFQRRYTTCTEA